MNIILCILIVLLLVVAVVLAVKFAGTSTIRKEVASFQNIFQHTNDTLMLIDIVDGKVMYDNKGAETLLGYPLKELYTKTIFDLHEREQMARSSEIIAKV